ncbi:MAG: hypothetical protein H6831_07560 [Planctomycetes bacterium]|nr:hypothetical protein [Planctomycetota bacterium]MCB9904247.1 hypothetical protein [Planctomycetota bacterium]
MRRRIRAAALGLACLAGSGSVAAGGTDALSAPDLGFEVGLGGWQQACSLGGTPFSALEVDGRSVARCALPGAGDATLWHDWTPAQLGAPLPVAGFPGERLRASFELWLGGDVGAGSLTLRLVALENGGERELSRADLALDSAPRGAWFRYSTAVATGGLSAATSAVRLECTLNAPGEVRIDEGRLGFERPSRVAGLGGDFEEAAGWSADVGSFARWSDATIGGYRGTGCALLLGNTATLERNVALLGAEDELCAGQAVEAGAWLRVGDGASLGWSPSAQNEVHVGVHARDALGALSPVLSETRWRPTNRERGEWHYVETMPIGDGTIPPGSTELVLRFTSNIASSVRVDEVSIGQQNALDGNPERMVGLNYVGRYRSPLYSLGAGELLDSGQNWRNWHWVTPPGPDASFTGFRHDPDCSTSPACFRPNGRRDVAVGTEFGSNDVPLIGAYDSRDADVLRYHLELAEALGVDFLVYEYLGHKLAVQNELAGSEAINEETFESILDVLEDPQYSLKTAVMYEPKVHMQGWVSGEPTLFDKKDGIAEDLSYLVDHYEDARGVLRRDGKFVVFLFRDRSCNGSGTQCLDASDWEDILDWVEYDTGERLFLIADAMPVDGAPFGGMSRWDLVSREILRYRTFADAAAGTPTQPAPAASALELHCAQRHDLGRNWELGDPWRRLHVPIVWPGFDDTGVAGWGLDNLQGEDGQPLGVRVADPLGGAFYRTTVTSALDSGARWVQIATFNDWNEGTRIEPAWDPNFGASQFSSLVLDARVRRQVFGRALETQAWIAGFKGTNAQPADVPRIALRYMLQAAFDPTVTQYD